MARQIPAWLVVGWFVALTGWGLSPLSPLSQLGAPVVSPVTSGTGISLAMVTSIGFPASMVGALSASTVN